MSSYRLLSSIIKLILNPNDHKRLFVPKEKTDKYVILNNEKFEITFLQLLSEATKNDFYISIDETVDNCRDACFRRIIIDFRGSDQFIENIHEFITYLSRIKRILFLRIAVIIPKETKVKEINLNYENIKMDSKVFVTAFQSSSDAITWLVKNV